PDSPNQTTQRPDLKEGQMVSGEIVDRRYNEVSIQLEPGNQTVTARLADDVSLSIGQKAQFLITDNSSGQLTLKYIPTDANSASDVIIQKALTASNLPLTDLNKAIVNELLNHSMSIDKQTLQLMVKLSHVNPGTAPLTLVLMLKNQIPLTQSN